MTALYNEKQVYVASVSSDKTYVLASYTEDGKGLFKIDVKELENMSVMLQAELSKESY